MAGFGTRVVRHLIEQKRRVALQTALDQESGPEEDCVEIDLRIEDCPVGPNPRNDDAHLDVCFAWLAALHALLIDAGTLGAGVSLVDTTESHRSFAEAIANGRAFGVTWSPPYEFEMLKEHIRVGRLSPERARHQLDRVRTDLQRHEKDSSAVDLGTSPAAIFNQLRAGQATTSMRSNQTSNDLRSAKWFSQATKQRLYPDLLRRAEWDKRLKRSVKKHSRWYHSVSEVYELYPDFKEAIIERLEAETNEARRNEA